MPACPKGWGTARERGGGALLAADGPRFLGHSAGGEVLGARKMVHILRYFRSLGFGVCDEALRVGRGRNFARPTDRPLILWEKRRENRKLKTKQYSLPPPPNSFAGA